MVGLNYENNARHESRNRIIEENNKPKNKIRKIKLTLCQNMWPILEKVP